MYRAVALALSAMPMALALASLGLSLLLVVEGSQDQPAHASTKGCPPGQRQTVGYPLVCDPVYKANTESGVGEGSEPRCKVHPVLTCEDAPSRRKTVASPLFYRAGPWAAQAPRAHAPVHVKGFYSVLSRDSLETTQHEHKMSPMKPTVVAATPAKVASPDVWEEVTEFKRPVPTMASSAHRSSSSSSNRPSPSGKWEQPRPAAHATVATSARRGSSSSSGLPSPSSSSSGQWKNWEEVTVL